MSDVKAHHIKIHYGGPVAICGVQRGVYQDTKLSWSWDDVTCQRCLRRLESADVSKTRPPQKPPAP